MRKLLVVIIIILSSTIIQAQPDLIPYRKGNIWGYCDKNKKIIIKPEYESVTFFVFITYSAGKRVEIAKIKKNGKWGVINNTGNTILYPKYDALSFASGDSRFIKFIYTKYKGEYVIFDPKGNKVGEGKRAEIEPNLNIELIIPSKLKPQKKGKKWGFVKSGALIIPHKYDKVEDFNTKLKLARVMKKGKWGYINTQGVEYFED